MGDVHGPIGPQLIPNTRFPNDARYSRPSIWLHCILSLPVQSERREIPNPKSTLSTTKRILVTGGAGFLGSFLCERLVDAGHDVICIDNFFTSQKSNVTHLLGRAN